LIALALTRANRLRLARAFKNNKRVDFSIACAIEDQMGAAFVDDLENPTAFAIEQSNFFLYFAGDARGPGGRKMIAQLPPYRLLMPSPLEWIAAIRATHGDRLVTTLRYSFSAERLTLEHLDRLLAGSPFREAVRRIDAALAGQILDDQGGFFDLSDFDSAEDFVQRGLGFCLLDGDVMIGAAYSSLVCSQGIEISLFVSPEHRRQGIATALTSWLLRECLANNMEPHWDAANEESCLLAEKLGYVPTETYQALFLGDANA